MADSLFPIKPILDRVIVREDPVEENRILGVGLDGKAVVASQHFQKSRTFRGTVVATGDGVAMGGVYFPIPLEVGDRVLLGEYGGERIYVKPEDEVSADKSLPILWEYRVADIRGKIDA